jgi:F0F1-type ATP synthase alpha subunit
MENFRLESDTVGAALFGDATGVREGDTVRSLEVPVGPQLFGRVVDPLGKLLDATALQCTAAAKCEALADQMFLERLCPKRPCRTRGSQSRG